MCARLKLIEVQSEHHRRVRPTDRYLQYYVERVRFRKHSIRNHEMISRDIDVALYVRLVHGHNLYNDKVVYTVYHDYVKSAAGAQ